MYPSEVKNGCSGVNNNPELLIVYTPISSPSSLQAAAWDSTVCLWSIAITSASTSLPSEYENTLSPTTTSSIFFSSSLESKILVPSIKQV